MTLPSFKWRKVNSPLTQGFTLVETVVAIGVLGIFFAAISLILQQVLQNVGESRVRATAVALAQQKMELIRNLPFAQVGTVGGIPAGPTLPTEQININGQNFSVITSIVYIDDPFDGVAPADTVPTDYKRARVEITWSGSYPSRVPVTSVTNIAPKGVETIVGGGTLFIKVFDANGLPVSNADVKVDNSVVNPQVHIQTLTNSNGLVVLPGAPACNTCYQITISKSGYSSDKTYSTGEVANPLQPYTSVIAGSVSQVSFAIDLLANLTLTSYGSRDNGFPLLGNVTFTLKGAKLIGYDTNTNPVYKYQFSTTTNSSGVLSLTGLEWDSYTLDFTTSSFTLAGSNPISPISLTPGANLSAAFSAIAKPTNSVLVSVKNATQQQLASGSIELRNNALGYIATKSAGATASADFGEAYFGSLTSGTYQFTATLSGYQTGTASAAINGNVLETMILNP